MPEKKQMALANWQFQDGNLDSGTIASKDGDETGGLSMRDYACADSSGVVWDACQ